MAILSKGKTFSNGELVTPQKLHELVDLASITGIVTAEITDSAITTAKIADANVTTAKLADSAVTSAKIADGTIVNADISAAAAIADTKLATISTAGKVSNSATTAASTNIANAIVTRDSLGNFSAGTITAALAGTAATATKLATARTITLGGDLSGSVSFDGSANATLTAAVADDSHNHTIANIDNLQTALDGKQANLGFTPVQQGGGTNQGTNKVYIGWNSPNLRVQVDSTDFSGTWPINISGTANPTSHTHGNITSAGAIGTISGVPVITGTSGVLQAGSFGTTAGTFCQGNDSRLSNSRFPTYHTHDADQITSGTLSNDRLNATSANAVNNLVLRDANGNFSAGTISANVLQCASLNSIASVSGGSVFRIFEAITSGSAYGALEFNRGSAAGATAPYVQFYQIGASRGNITPSGASGVAYNTSSDYRLKTNLEPLTDAVARLLQIPVHRFNWLADPDAPKVDGFLAHEAQAIVPESVTGHKDEVDAEGKPVHQGIDQSKLVPLLVAAVQELAARVEALEAAQP